MMWDIEIAPDALGCPEVVLHGGALKRLEAIGGRRVMVSITHADGFAAAMACVVGG